MATPILLSPEERVVLTQWARRRDGGDLRPLRARMVLEAASGKQNREIARVLGVSRLTVARWRLRFLTSRLRGIQSAAAPSTRVGRISEEKVQAIVRRTSSSASGSGRLWTTRSLARQFGVSHTTVHRIWDAYRIRPERFPALPFRPSPRAPLVPLEVVGLYLRPPDYGVAVVLGRSIRPQDARSIPQRPLEQRPDDPVAVGSDGPSPLGELVGDVSVLSRDVTTAEIRSTNLLRFLSGVSREVGPASDVRIVATRASAGRAPTLDRWQVRHPNFRLEMVPDALSWRRRASLEIRTAGRYDPSRGRAPRRLESARSLALALAAYTEGGGPFEWTATRDEIAAGSASIRLRYDLSVTGHPSFKKVATDAFPMAPRNGDDDKAREMARVVLRKSLKVRSGEQVTIESWSGTVEYANAFVLETLRLGARPMLLYEDEPTYWAAATEVQPEYLARLGEHRRAAVENTDVLVSFFGPSDRERFHALPRPAMFKLGEYHDALYRAAARAGVRAVLMAVGRSSPASARMYGVDYPTWRSELVDAALVDPTDLHRRGQRIVDRIAAGRSVAITHPNGTELHVRLKGRKPELSDGLVPRAQPRGNWNLVTLPAGVVQVAVDEKYAEGTFRSNVSSSVGLSDTVGEMAGGQWTFKDGRLTRFVYDQGEETFEESYATGGLGRDRPASLSIGLNDRIAISPLLEDQGAGTVTFHIGRNEHLAGSTRSGWWAWLCLRGATVAVDGKTLVRVGRLRP